MFRNFMMGRYGNDHLNMALMIASLALGILSMMFAGVVDAIFALLQFIFLCFWLFRAFSRNFQKRQRENMSFLRVWTKVKNKFSAVSGFVNRLKDREHRYFKCPDCKSRLRVPKGRGNITITCPKCKTKFDKKS